MDFFDKACHTYVVPPLRSIAAESSGLLLTISSAVLQYARIRIHLCGEPRYKWVFIGQPLIELLQVLPFRGFAHQIRGGIDIAFIVLGLIS